MSYKNSYYYILTSISNNIEYYQNMIANCDVLFKRWYYKRQLYNERMRLINHLNQEIL